PGRALDRDAGRDRRLAGRVLPLPGAQDLAQDDLGDLAALDPGALQRGLDRDLAQLVRRQIGERPVECANRRARRADDDDVGLHTLLPVVGGATARRPRRCGPSGLWSRASITGPPASFALDPPPYPVIVNASRLDLAYVHPGAIDPCQSPHGRVAG